MKMSNKLADAYLMWMHSNADTSSKVGYWLEDFDVNAHGGRGHVTLTAIKARAKRFESKEAAFEYWRQIPSGYPKRTDGKPNRPLTAYTIEILPETDEPLPHPDDFEVKP